jgi:serine/threonine protein kinase
LDVQGPFSAREAAHVGIELCRALGAVHAAGLLHRDVKAGNAMREAGGRILLMDFGLTHEGEGRNLAGTPPYMAPELLSGGPASVGSDLYALGVLLFHLTTAKYPVEASTFSDYHQAHRSGSRRNLMDLRPDLPEPFVQVIETAADPNPCEALRFGRADAHRSIGSAWDGVDPTRRSARHTPSQTQPVPILDVGADSVGHGDRRGVLLLSDVAESLAYGGVAVAPGLRAGPETTRPLLPASKSRPFHSSIRKNNR